MSFELTEEEKEDHTLVLAYERTLLSRDRTMMSVLRTALSFVAIGAAFVGFHKEASWFFVTGWSCVAIGAVSFFVGLVFMIKSHIRMSRFSHLKEWSKGKTTSKKS